MSDQGVKKHPGDRNIEREPATHGARRDGSGSPHRPRPSIFLIDGEIRDPLGNFSEQIGAYFG